MRHPQYTPDLYLLGRGTYHCLLTRLGPMRTRLHVLAETGSSDPVGYVIEREDGEVSDLIRYDGGR